MSIDLEDDKDIGTIVCPHVFEDTRDITVVIHSRTGWWQCLCGDANCLDLDLIRWVGLSHLMDRDASLRELMSLGSGQVAVREDKDAPWTFEEEQ
jgi:hypothetical protein